MNRSILLTILWSVSASIGWTQDAEPTVGNGAPPDRSRSKTATADFPFESQTTSDATDERPNNLPIALRQLEARLRNAQLTLAKQREFFGNQHPSVVEQERSIKSLETMIRDQLATFKPGTPDDQVTSTRPQAEKNVPSQIKVFSLRYCDATSAVEVLQQLVTDPTVRIIADKRTNSVIVNAPVEQFELQTIEALLLRLDVATQTHGAKTTPFQDEARPKTTTDSSVAPDQPTVDLKEHHDQVTLLRRTYESTETQARQLAESLRQSPDDAKKAELRTVVQQAFTLRQRLLRAELLEMQTRLLQAQRSIDMRERITDQIVDRRVEELLNPQLKWDAMPASGSKEPQTSVRPDFSHPPAPIGLSRPPEISKNARGEPQNGLRLSIVARTENGGHGPTAPINELEGDWHRVASRDKDGHSKDVIPFNTTFRGDRYTSTFPGGTYARRIQINSEPKTIWYFSKEEDESFTMDHYELKGDQLILRDSMDREQIFERGHVRIPSVVPSATESQESRWRSAVVEILVSGKPDVSDIRPRKIGFGIIMAADGTMLSHMSGGWASVVRDWPNIDAKFDDGSVIPLQVIEEGGSGFLILRPKDTINLNHHFQLSGGPTEIGDQVYVGQMVVTSIESGLYGLAATAVKLAQIDRRVAALGRPVWQLTPALRIPNSFCFPVLSGSGELLAITLADTGGLLLAVPAEQLKEMFPKSLSPPPTEDAAPVLNQ